MITTQVCQRALCRFYLAPKYHEPSSLIVGLIGLLVPPGKASYLLTDHLIAGHSLMSEPALEKLFKSNYPYVQVLLVYFKHILDVMTS